MFPCHLPSELKSESFVATEARDLTVREENSPAADPCHAFRKRHRALLSRQSPGLRKNAWAKAVKKLFRQASDARSSESKLRAVPTGIDAHSLRGALRSQTFRITSRLSFVTARP